MGEVYILEVNNDCVVSFVCSAETESLADTFSEARTGVKHPIKSMINRVRRGKAIWFYVQVHCLNSKTDKIGSDTLSCCFDDSVDAFYSSNFHGYLSDMVNAAKQEAGVLV